MNGIETVTAELAERDRRIVVLRQELHKALSQLDLLRGYAEHANSCGAQSPVDSHCSCGFSKLLKEMGEG